MLSPQPSARQETGGSVICSSRDEKTRTSDLHVPNVARYQLCYIPMDFSDRKGNKNIRLSHLVAIKRSAEKLDNWRDFIRRKLINRKPPTPKDGVRGF